LWETHLFDKAKHILKGKEQECIFQTNGTPNQVVLTQEKDFKISYQKSLHIDKRSNYKHMHTEHSILKFLLVVHRVKLRLETLFWAYFLLGFLKTGSCKLFPQTGFILPAAWFLPSNYLRLQTWTTRAWKTAQFTKQMLMFIKAHSDQTQQL
jgi:hypothetical protein